MWTDRHGEANSHFSQFYLCIKNKLKNVICNYLFDIYILIEISLRFVTSILILPLLVQ